MSPASTNAPDPANFDHQKYEQERNYTLDTKLTSLLQHVQEAQDLVTKTEHQRLERGQEREKQRARRETRLEIQRGQHERIFAEQHVERERQMEELRVQVKESDGRRVVMKVPWTGSASNRNGRKASRRARKGVPTATRQVRKGLQKAVCRPRAETRKGIRR
jgi:N-methylhydantoinase B/oxoprolinase/acetone carboxylase alpha subunit